MSVAACKQILCAWNEVFTMPHGHALETILRMLCGHPSIADESAKRFLTRITVPILQKPQMTFEDQDAIRKVFKELMTEPKM